MIRAHEKLDDSIISNFVAVDHHQFSDFTPENLDEFNRILKSLLTNRIQPFADVIRAVHDHLNDRVGHPSVLKEHYAEIIDDIYQTYLEVGGTGTVADMLSCLDKSDVKVGTPEDVAAGISTSKTTSAVAWKRLFDEHLNDSNAHEELLNSIDIPKPFKSFPSLVFNDMVPLASGSVVDLAPVWNEDGTTIAFNVAISDYTGDLFELEFGDKTLKLTCDENTVSVIANRTFLTSVPRVIGPYLLKLNETNVYLVNSSTRAEVDYPSRYDEPSTFTLATAIGGRSSIIADFILYSQMCPIDSEDYFFH
jgi:hypothetical protein